MLRIEYRKHFLTGTLAGISVNEFFDGDRDLATAYVESLQLWTPDNPGEDTLTGTKYWVSRVSVGPIKFSEREYRTQAAELAVFGAGNRTRIDPRPVNQSISEA